MSLLAQILATVILVAIATVIMNSLIGAMSGDRPEDSRTTFLDLLRGVLGGIEWVMVEQFIETLFGSRVIRWVLFAVLLIWLLKIAVVRWMHGAA